MLMAVIVHLRRPGDMEFFTRIHVHLLISHTVLGLNQGVGDELLQYLDCYCASSSSAIVLLA